MKFGSRCSSDSKPLSTASTSPTSSVPHQLLRRLLRAAGLWLTRPTAALRSSRLNTIDPSTRDDPITAIAHNDDPPDLNGIAVVDVGLVDSLAKDIHAGILTGKFPVGSWLRQQALAKQYGVSRTPIREALRKLQADRIVDVIPNRGAHIKGTTAEEIRDRYYLRAEIEGVAAEFAATRITPEGLRRLQAAQAAYGDAVAAFVTEMEGKPPIETINDQPDWYGPNVQFHDAILEALHVKHLELVPDGSRGIFPSIMRWTAMSEEPSVLQETVHQHARILSAIERRDAAAARRWSVDHHRRAGEIVAAWYEARMGQTQPRDSIQ